MKIIKLLTVSFMLMISLAGCKSSDKANDEQVKDDNMSGSDMTHEEDDMSMMAEFGVVSGIDLENNQIKITLNGTTGDDKKGDENDLVLNISDTTYYVDSKTGKVLDIATLKIGDKVVAWVSPERTASLPPQASTSIILTDNETDVIPALVEVKSVDKKDGSIVIKTEIEGADWTLAEGVIPTDLLSQNEMSVDDIKEGVQALLWPKNMTEADQSAGIVAEKVVIVKK